MISRTKKSNTKNRFPSYTAPTLFHMNDIEKRILFEDNHLVIINKLPGEIVQGDKTGDVPLVEKVRSYLKERYRKPGNVFCGLVHRIDRPVSGAVIFAKTSKALTRMNAMLQTRAIKKIYWAVVEGNITEPEQRLVHFLKKNEKLNKSFSVADEKAGQRAELHYTNLFQLDNYTLLEVELMTGRHHQIRVQLTAIGHPIKGDLKYGAARSNEDHSISLHARKVEFIHPVSKETISVIAPTPLQGIWKHIPQNC